MLKEMSQKLKKLVSVIIVCSLALGLASCASAPANNTVTVQAMTYAEYMAASNDAKVLIEGYLQCYAYNFGFKRVNMFLQDDDGAYYVYMAVCDDEKAAQLSPGVKVRVSGVKGSYAGEVEIQEQGTFEVLSEKKIYEPTDVTSLLGDEKSLEKMMNRKISVKDLTVLESYDKEDRVFASLYKWDGSGKAGEGDDIYFSASNQDNPSLFVIESDENPEGSAVYDAALGLAVGDVIDLDGYMYWYNGPNIHVNSIKVKKTSKADLTKDPAALSHDDYLKAADGEQVIIEAYVQGVSEYNEEEKRYSAYLSDADGAYYAKDLISEQPDYEKYTNGAKFRIKGVKATENGMPVITGITETELLEGYYIAPAVNATALLDDENSLSDMTGQKVVVKGTTFAAANLEEGAGIIQTIGANGKVYSFVLGSEDHSEDSDIYKTVDEVSPGDVIDLVCFVFLDPEPVLRIQSITVK